MTEAIVETARTVGQSSSVAVGGPRAGVGTNHAIRSQPSVPRLRIAHLQGWKALLGIGAAVRPRFVASMGWGRGDVSIMFRSCLDHVSIMSFDDVSPGFREDRLPQD